MNELQIFNYSNNQVRTVLKDGQPYFVAKDVCDILEISNVTMAIERLSQSMKGVSSIETLGGKQEVNVINEAGVYKLVFTSRKPEAEKFTDWVASEVLPSIRKHSMHLIDLCWNCTTWLKRMAEYGFTKGIDFAPFSEESTDFIPLKLESTGGMTIMTVRRFETSMKGTNSIPTPGGNQEA